MYFLWHGLHCSGSWVVVTETVVVTGLKDDNVYYPAFYRSVCGPLSHTVARFNKLKKIQLKQYYDLRIISHPSIPPSIGWFLAPLQWCSTCLPISRSWFLRLVWLPGTAVSEAGVHFHTSGHEGCGGICSTSGCCCPGPDVGSTWAKLASGAGPVRWWAFGSNHFYTKLSHTPYHLLRMALLELSIITPPSCRPRNQELEKWLPQGQGKM